MYLEKIKERQGRYLMDMMKELRTKMFHYDQGIIDALCQDLGETAEMATVRRITVSELQGEIILLKALQQDTTKLEDQLKVDQTLLHALEAKINYLRRDLYSRDSRRFGFLRR